MGGGGVVVPTGSRQEIDGYRLRPTAGGSSVLGRRPPSDPLAGRPPTAGAGPFFPQYTQSGEAGEGVARRWPAPDGGTPSDRANRRTSTITGAGGRDSGPQVVRRIVPPIDVMKARRTTAGACGVVAPCDLMTLKAEACGIGFGGVIRRGAHRPIARGVAGERKRRPGWNRRVAFPFISPWRVSAPMDRPSAVVPLIAPAYLTLAALRLLGAARALLIPGGQS